MKRKLSTALILTHLVAGNLFVFTTDVSAVRTGADLAQESSEGLRPITDFSRVLSKTQARYYTYAREFLAVIMATRHL